MEHYLFTENCLSISNASADIIVHKWLNDWVTKERMSKMNHSLVTVFDSKILDKRSSEFIVRCHNHTGDKHLQQPSDF